MSTNKYYTIQNKLEIDMFAADLKTELAKVGVPYATTIYNEYGGLSPDIAALTKALEKASQFTWICPNSQSDALFDETELRNVKKGMYAEDVAIMYARKKLGFYNLKPQEKVEIVENPYYLEEFKKSGRIALNCRVWDSEGNLIWDGKPVEYKEEIYRSPKDAWEGKNIKLVVGTAVGGDVEPEQPKQPKPKKEKMQVNVEPEQPKQPEPKKEKMQVNIKHGKIKISS